MNAGLSAALNVSDLIVALVLLATSQSSSLTILFRARGHTSAQSHRSWPPTPTNLHPRTSRDPLRMPRKRRHLCLLTHVTVLSDPMTQPSSLATLAIPAIQTVRVQPWLSWVPEEGFHFVCNSSSSYCPDLCARQYECHWSTKRREEEGGRAKRPTFCQARPLLCVSVSSLLLPFFLLFPLFFVSVAFLHFCNVAVLVQVFTLLFSHYFSILLLMRPHD